VYGLVPRPVLLFAVPAVCGWTMKIAGGSSTGSTGSSDSWAGMAGGRVSSSNRAGGRLAD
jgi:hypothetical protein